MTAGNALLGGVTGMSVIFMLAWWWGRKRKNYSWVDACWAFGIGLTAISWLGLSGGILHLKLSIAGLVVGLWSVRLGWHLQARIRKAHPEEDARYVKLRELWRDHESAAFFLFFQAQALSVVLLALPFLSIALDSDTRWSGWESVGLLVTFLGILGEGLADWQMTQFKARNPGSGGVCRSGLWAWSRHPNYFFESVIWLGFYIYTCGSEWGWATLHAPLIILYLLLRVTGIPPTEAAALRRKGDAYRSYQKSVSPFIPWPPNPSKDKSEIETIH
jgi:steroid 5-alpha reductase family enzyme